MCERHELTSPRPLPPVGERFIASSLGEYPHILIGGKNYDFFCSSTEFLPFSALFRVSGLPTMFSKRAHSLCVLQVLAADLKGTHSVFAGCPQRVWKVSANCLEDTSRLFGDARSIFRGYLCLF